MVMDLSCSAPYMCWNATISCPVAANCTILCNDTFSCRSATIYGPIGYSLIVQCNEATSCDLISIHAEFTSQFTLIPIVGGDSMNIYFPPNIGGIKRAQEKQ